MPTLEDAIALAVQAHRGQVDRAGQPYILHPLRVMLRLQGEIAQIVGVLHDVVEDSDLTLDDLRQMGYPEVVIRALDAVTRRDGESYEAFVERSAAHPLGRQVKLADLEDNMDIRRFSGDLGEKDLARLNRYRRAWMRIMAEMARS
ncbi:MAG: HD domain-containing protein [Chloroflexi bacterium]|nr:MAG: HD domain-containing protein [Chloroflexota bacterium]